MKKKLMIILFIITIFLTGCNNEDYLNKNIETDDINKRIEEINNDNDTLLEINSNEEIDLTIDVIAVSSTSLSNKTIAWGFRRMKDNQQPEFTASYIKPLDDYQGIYIGNSGEKVIYLTFDEGYENGYTGSILDTLKEKEVSATFFVTMPYVKQNPDLVKRMIDEGHVVRKSYS